MQTVAVLNEKGGSGKTTVATNLAAAWHRGGADVLLLDADPQLTALDWSDSGDVEVPVVHLGDSSLEEDLPRVGESFELVVIDGAPRMGSLTVAAVRAADLVVIPIQPSAADIWSAETVVDVCQANGTAGVVVLSRSIVGTREADEATDALQSFNMPVLEGTAQRIAYSRALGQGKSVLDLPAATKAKEEIRSLASDILSHLNDQTNE